jgi:replicative DNA helicase
MKLSHVLEHIDARTTEGQEEISTGFSKLDNILDGGFRKKELIILGGQTGVGKSYIACQIFAKIATQGFNSGYFSLEVSNEMLASRIIAMKSGLPASHIMFGRVHKDHVDYLKAQGSLVAYDELMHFHDDIYKLIDIERIIKENRYEFVVIDFIQNIMSDDRDEYSRLSEVALRLQKLAKETDCVILCLSQLSNSVAKEKGESTSLEYKGSGSIAMVADLGFFLKKSSNGDKVFDPEMELRLAKNRRGVSGAVIQLGWKFPHGYMYER